jgi:hypothetical protein
MKMHNLAVELATRATADAGNDLKRRVVDRYTNAATDGECVFANLATGTTWSGTNQSLATRHVHPPTMRRLPTHSRLPRIRYL